MATSVFVGTADKLREAAKSHPRVLVSFSGGKDSSVCLDLALRSGFTEVVPFFMYLVPGLSFIDQRLEEAERRFGVKVIHVPHWANYAYIKEELFCTRPYHLDDLPEVKLPELYSMLHLQTGINLIINGGKKSDGLWRKRFIWSVRNKANIMHPIDDWNKWDVYAYLKARNIPVPQESIDMGAKGAGVDLHPDSLLWIYDNHPDDFRKIERVYPYVRAAVYRREWYGIGKDYRKGKAAKGKETSKKS